MDDSLLDKAAWIGERELRGAANRIVLRFSGLSAAGMKDSADSFDLEWGDAGALVVVPYHEPWAWMNPATRAFTDALLDGIIARYVMAADIPIIATGGSMGGQGALIYTRYSSRVTACAALSPVCDLPYHYTERPDLPRTLHHAFGSYDDISTSLIDHSPLHQVDSLPDIPYLIIHGERDQAVNKAQHSDKLVAAMRDRNLRVAYREMPDMAHCQPLTWELMRRLTKFVLSEPG